MYPVVWIAPPGAVLLASITSYWIGCIVLGRRAWLILLTQ
jgi:hypothetical protein